LQKRVLLVDDNKDIRDMMRFLLERQGLIVIEAEDGEVAVKKAVSESPDIILMDLSMPFMDGFDATRAIRKLPELSRVPIIAISAYGREYYDDAKAAGCDDVMQKPVDITALEPLLNSWFGTSNPTNSNF
jgi:CheY-like chemotaxis protein